MRLPMIWQPAKNANLTPATIQAPVGHVDLAKTFCQIAGIAPPDYCEGASMPTTNDEADAQDRQFQLTEWD